MVNPKPKSRAPSVTQDCPAALVIVWQYAAPDVTRNMLATVGADVVGAGVVGLAVGAVVVGLVVGPGMVGPEVGRAVGAVVGLVGAMVGEGVGAGVVGLVVGLVGAMVGEAVGATASQHSTQPLRTTDLSVRHVKVSSSATRTFCGPDVPAYRVPPMVTESQHDSVLNSVAVRAPAASTSTVQASLLPWLPTPEDVQ